ncbi:TolC family protein [Candidatus Margulisiibacteriota bacterium]
MKKIIWTCLLILIIPIIVFPLTWKESIVLTISNNTDLKTAQKKVQQAQNQVEIARVGGLPTLDGSMSANRSKSVLGIEGDAYSAGISSSQLLFDAGKTSTQVEKAEIGLKFAQIEYEKSMSDVLFVLRQSYLETLKYQKLIEITTEILTRRQKQYELINLRYKAGREHLGAVLEAKANLLHAQKEEVALRRRSRIAFKRFTNIIGVPIQDNISEVLIAGKPQNTVLFLDLAQNHYTYRLLELTQASAEKDLTINTAALWPSLYANGNYRFSGDEFFPKEDTWSVGLQMTYTLWDWAKRGNQIMNAELELSQAQSQVEETLSGLAIELEDKYLAWQNAYDAVQVQKAFLEAVHARAKIADLSYSNGTMTFDNWLLVENDLAGRAKVYVETIAAALAAEAVWINTKGGGYDVQK